MASAENDRPRDFRFNATRAFLTYPQCGELSKERLLEFLRDERGAAWYCIGLEQHQDGRNHLHAYVEFGSRLHTRDARHFDVDGQHPNIQPVRSANRVIRYVQKGGDYIGNIEPKGSNAVSYGAILQQATGVDDFLQLVVEHHPRDAILNHERLLSFARHRWGEPRTEYIPTYTTFRDHSGLNEWVTRNIEPYVATATASAPVHPNPNLFPPCCAFSNPN